MDEYLQCLYSYILEVRRDETLRKTPEYCTQRRSLLEAMHAMQDALPRDLREIVDAYLTCQSHLSVLESDWLFQEAVSLGKWMAR